MKKALTIILTFSLFLIVLTVPARMTSPAPFTIYTFDEYQMFIEENDLPEDFIYYNSVSMFGKFKKLEFLTMFTGSFAGKVDNYRYMLEVEKGDEALDYGGYIELEICSVYDEYLKYWGGEQIEGDVDDFLPDFVKKRNIIFVFFCWLN